jgi:alpha-mannosidase
MRRTVAIVPHTHWDREWYAPFQTFRMQLVDLLDELLPRLTDDPGHAHFLLDGQMAVVDDYLAIRPEAAGTLRRLGASGRVAMGPWYILMDEFCVSGETIVRDLQMGIERAAAFGGAMEVGYLPDMFGHVAQMPQILRQFGFGHAVVWRGVPSAVDRSGFWWEAPDGSTVRAEFLPGGYGNGATLPDDAKELVAMVTRFEAEHAGVLVGDVLWMNGTDHMKPRPWLGRVVAEANAIQDDLRFVVTSLAEHLAAAPLEGLPRWHGELRSGAYSNLLMGVVSNRVDVRRAAAAAERSLERLAEPLSALFLPPEHWPAAFLAEAWRHVVLNAAHDSSCACSTDEVVDAVLLRYGDATQIGLGLTGRALKALADSVSATGPLVVNPTSRPRTDLLELQFPGLDPCPHTQVLAVDDGVTIVDGVSRADCVTLVQNTLDNFAFVLDAEARVDDDGTLDIRFRHDPAQRRVRYGGPIRSEVAALVAERPDGPARLTITAPPSHRAVAQVAALPGFGWRVWEPEPVETAPVRARADGFGLANGEIEVVVDPADGTLTLVELGPDGPTGRTASGLGRLVDGGDTGDTYNYNRPADDTSVTDPVAVEVSLVESGPLRGRLRILRRYVWPTHAVGHRRVGEVEVEVDTVVEVQTGSPLVRVDVTFDNPTRDHRLRAHFPLPEPAAASFAECAFAVVERGLLAEGGPTEQALATFPSRRFVAAGGLLVVHEGLHEYELVDLDDPTAPTSADTLALTLLRATGMLSNGPMASRPLPAGPVMPAPGAQVPGLHHARFGLAFDREHRHDTAGRWARAHAHADELAVPLLTQRARGRGERPPAGQALSVTGAEVSAVQRHGESLLVRIVNPSDRPTTVTLDGRAGWVVDLRGRPLEPFEATVDLGPWQIATLHC